jgi:cysteine synthase A
MDTASRILDGQLPPTPLAAVQLGSGPAIWCKLEFLNPSGSTKDRIARHILSKALRERRVEPGGTVIEASSGSTSIAMALTCAQLRLRFIAVMPEGVSNERVLMIRGFGGDVRFTPREQGVAGSIVEAERLARELGAFLPKQFSNPDNAAAHQLGTAAEILDQIPGGRVDAVVSGVGTGGTLVGLIRGCAPRRAFLARPVNIVHAREEECCSFSYRIPGVIDCMSTIFRLSDFPGLSVIEVEDEDAIATTRELIRAGFPVGPSSGLNYRAALAAAAVVGAGNIVTVFPDRMERYFTTELFAPFRDAAATSRTSPLAARQYQSR